jgi:hypothetical protein
MSQRLIRRTPHPDREGIQTIIDQLAKTRPQMKNLNPGDFIDPSILKEIEDSGFIKSCMETSGAVSEEKLNMIVGVLLVVRKDC